MNNRFICKVNKLRYPCNGKYYSTNDGCFHYTLKDAFDHLLFNFVWELLLEGTMGTRWVNGRLVIKELLNDRKELLNILLDHREVIQEIGDE